ncbi:MAG TPA: hypothetical protein VKX17_13115 [Planctomycetota bacterium]|nr:hypothetical protein [Planctomycetota bacterium]
MPLRRFYFIQAIVLTVCALGALLMPIFASRYYRAPELPYILFAGFAIFASVNFWRALKTPNDQIVPRVQHAPTDVQLSYYRRMLIAAAIAFPLLTAYITYELYQLESGTAQSVQIWAPVAGIYQLIGFWPAVLFVPILGVICCTVFIFRIRHLRANSANRNPGEMNDDQNRI